MSHSYNHCIVNDLKSSRLNDCRLIFFTFWVYFEALALTPTNAAAEGSLTDSPFAYFLLQTFHAHTALRPRSPCCSGHNGRILSRKHPPQWSRIKPDQTCTQLALRWSRLALSGRVTVGCLDLSVAGPGVFEAAAQAINSVCDELPCEVVLHSPATGTKDLSVVDLMQCFLIISPSRFFCGLTGCCIWRGRRSSFPGRESCTPQPLHPTGYQWKQSTGRLLWTVSS